MPECYPPYQTCHRHFQEWVSSGTFEVILKILVQDKKGRGDFDLTEFILLPPFSSQKWGSGAGKTNRDKGPKITAMANRQSLSIAISVRWASLHETTGVEPTLESMFTTKLPESLANDQGYDSDPVDQKLAENNVDLIAPPPSNRKKGKPQDGRKLCFYLKAREREAFVFLVSELSTHPASV